MSEIFRFAGSRMLLMGTPLAVVGLDHDEKAKTLLFEAHVFFDGKEKIYHPYSLQSDYEDVDAAQIPTYIEIAHKMVMDEIERIILDEMDAKKLPFHLYSKLNPCEPKDFSLLLYSLWSRGYEEEIMAIANSPVGKLREEFSKITKLTKVRVSFPAAAR